MCLMLAKRFTAIATRYFLKLQRASAPPNLVWTWSVLKTWVVVGWGFFLCCCVVVSVFWCCCGGRKVWCALPCFCSSCERQHDGLRVSLFFFGVAALAKLVVGLFKVVNALNFCSARLRSRERLAYQVFNYVKNSLYCVKAGVWAYVHNNEGS
ncbi:GTP cyclohydrolase 1 [Candidatus Hodgkinia cicadicola]|nr:GTP cyclohydrolase 1 [Candidatus Hodgkinia cicadicola]